MTLPAYGGAAGSASYTRASYAAAGMRVSRPDLSGPGPAEMVRPSPRPVAAVGFVPPETKMSEMIGHFKDFLELAESRETELQGLKEALGQSRRETHDSKKMISPMNKKVSTLETANGKLKAENDALKDKLRRVNARLAAQMAASTLFLDRVTAGLKEGHDKIKKIHESCEFPEVEENDDEDGDERLEFLEEE